MLRTHTVADSSMSKSKPFLRVDVALSVEVLGYGQQRLLVNSWIARLIEGQDAHLQARVLFDDLVCLLVGVERVHENEGDVGIVLLVQGLDLLHSQVQEGLVFADRDCRLRTLMERMFHVRTYLIAVQVLAVLLLTLHPIEVPRPPFSFTRINFPRSSLISESAGAKSEL